MFKNFLKRSKTEVVTPAVTQEVETAEKVKGKVFVVESSGSLLPNFFTKKDADSKQLEVSREWLTTNSLVTRTYPASSFITLRDRCPVLGAAIDCIANDVSSTGWQLTLKEDIKQSNATDSERKELEDFLKHPNDEQSLKELIAAAIVDLQTIGDFSLEVARNNAGRVGKIFHLPSRTIYKNRDEDRFVQKRNTKTVWFVPFASGIEASAKNGEEGKYNKEQRCNEVIFKALYNSDGYYGRSPMLSCVGAVKASISCEEFNTYFFDNRGLPEFAVLLTGEWSEGSEQKMSVFMSKELKGNENRGKTLVMVVPDQCKCEFKPLEASAKTREGSFRLYATDLEDRILSVYRCPRSKIGIQRVGKLGGSDTFESLRNYSDSVVEPLQNIIEDIFNQKLLPAVLGSDTSFNLVLNNLHVDDFVSKTEALIKLLEKGAITPNELRARLALGSEYPDGDKFYIASTLVEAGEPGDLSKLEPEIEEE